MCKAFYIIIFSFCFFSLPIKALPSISDADWLVMNTLPSINGEVNAIAVADNGDVYLGGSFTVLGDLSVAGIARWDGQDWWSLGTGVAGTVHSIKIHDNQIYVGGSFSQAGGIAAQNIAKWDGSQWQALSSGVNGGVYALDIDAAGTLLVAGSFTLAGAVAANRIALWDGANWSALGTGVNGDVRALLRHNHELYVGGSFTTADGITVNRIARWNGSNWFGLATGVNGSVTSLAAADGVLFVGGSFTTAGGVAANRIAKWDGAAWAALDTGVSNQVNVLLFDGDTLIVGGNFNTAGGQTVSRLAKWDGSAWSGVSGGLNSNVNALGRSDNQLYVGGSFSAAGGVPAEKFAIWDGSSWFGLGEGLNGVINAFAQIDNVIYVAGAFTRIGEVAANRVARWDGHDWFPLGEGLNGVVNSLAVLDGMLYAAGSFSSAGGGAANNIARWDGVSWQGLGAGVNGAVNALVVSGTELLVGGAFTQAGGIVVNRIASWDGTGWFALGTGVNNEVRALALMQDELYAAGSFTLAASTPVNRIAKWNGSSWSALAGGVNGVVNTLTVSDDTLFVGGGFTTAGGNTANRLAKWANGSWLSIGTDDNNGLSNTVRAIAVKGGAVFTGGAFVSAGSISANRIAGWNGSHWFTLGSGTNGNVSTLQIRDNRLYVAGDFVYAGGKFSPFFASVDLAAFSYTLTYDANGATAGSPPVTQHKDFNSVLALSGNSGGLAKTGYTFTGWNTAADGSGTTYAAGAAYSENASVTLYATWLINQYTISFDSKGGSAVAPIVADFGAVITAPANPVRGTDVFLGWEPAIPASMPANDLNLNALWGVTSYQVRFLDWDNRVLQVQYVEPGQAASTTLIPERAGYTFTGWSADLAVITADIDVIARYEPLRYTVNASVIGAGQVSPASQMRYYGEIATFSVSLDNDADIVVVQSECGAQYINGQLVTAAIVGNCTIALSVYQPLLLKADDALPGPGQRQIRHFSLSGGSGNHRLLAASITRSGSVLPMSSGELATVLQSLGEGRYRFSASRTGRYRFQFIDELSRELVEVSFDILPYLAFTTSRQQLSPAQQALVSVWLSDEAIEYPVTALLQAEQAEPAVAGIYLTFENGRQQTFSVSASSASALLRIDPATVNQALPGSPIVHILSGTDKPALLPLRGSLWQAGELTNIIQRQAGNVQLSVVASGNDTLQYQWYAADISLNTSENKAFFDPSTLQLGSYEVLVSATDGRQAGAYSFRFRIIEACGYDSCITTSGVPSAFNPLRDFRHRLLLCPNSGVSANRVDSCTAEALLFAEVPGPYRLALGLFADEASWQSGQFGLALNEGTLLDDGHTQLGFIVNFDILGLSVPGSSVPVVVPLPMGRVIPTNAVWRKYTNMQWHDFVEDANNQVQSALRDDLGLCPSVSATVWQDGLNTGYDCIRLIIEDGGPNDDDAAANSVIRDPGVLAVRNHYTLSFNSNGGSAVAPVTQVFGSTLNILPPVREGYAFIRWEPELPGTMPAADMEFIAQWQLKQYEVRFDTAGGKAIVPLSVNFGAVIVAPEPVRLGYVFRGWQPALPETMPARDVQVMALWERISVEEGAKNGSIRLFEVIMLLFFALWRRRTLQA